MAVDTKALRNRIKSVDSTLHLTKAMGLVASSKIRRASAAMARGREYAAAAERAVRTLAGRPGLLDHPYFTAREGKTRLIVIAGDRGLAGGYNANIFRLVRDLTEGSASGEPVLDERGRTVERIEDPEILPIGKRACERYRGGEMLGAEGFPREEAVSLARSLCEDYLAGEYARLAVVRTKYVSMMTQRATVEFLLPLSFPEEESSSEDKTPAGEVLFEPSEEAVLAAALPVYLGALLLADVREAFASEVAARRVAMDAAGKNAQVMIDDLTLAYNRARQGAITQEITEIVAGAGENAM